MVTSYYGTSSILSTNHLGAYGKITPIPRILPESAEFLHLERYGDSTVDENSVWVRDITSSLPGRAVLQLSGKDLSKKTQEKNLNVLHHNFFDTRYAG